MKSYDQWTWSHSNNILNKYLSIKTYFSTSNQDLFRTLWIRVSFQDRTKYQVH